MRLRIVFIFLIAILIPTTLLAYFGLLAIRSEKSIIEKNMRQRYEAMADIVVSEITSTLKTRTQEQISDTEFVESIILEEASIFKDRIAIFNTKNEAIGPLEDIEARKPALSRLIDALPYRLVVYYEKYPLLRRMLEKRQKRVYLYASVIIFSAFFILGGSFLTLRALAHEWRLARLKTEFVEHLSHDLRKPLTSIRMFAEMLQTDRVPNEAKRREYYNIITNESERLTHLADNILDFSRIEQKRARGDFKHGDISRVVTDVVERFKTYMIAENREITLDIQDSFPMVKMDVSAISQAVMNLLSNADKYSPADKEIKVDLRKQNKTVVIDISDRGTGIPKREHKKIFQKFYRIANKKSIEASGSGLGLILVKYAMDIHRGKVIVESKEGVGTKFSLVFPM